jgi:hypothetical protein
VQRPKPILPKPLLKRYNNTAGGSETASLNMSATMSASTWSAATAAAMMSGADGVAARFRGSTIPTGGLNALAASIAASGGSDVAGGSSGTSISGGLNGNAGSGNVSASSSGGLQLSSLPPPPPPLLDPSERFKVLDVDPLEFARQLTLIEYELYRAIKVRPAPTHFYASIRRFWLSPSLTIFAPSSPSRPSFLSRRG